MDIRTLEYFLKIYECGNISLAAKQLFITQQGLSKAMRSLEHQFRSQLFIRNSDGVELTKQGEVFLDYALNVKQKYSNMIKKFEALNPQKSLYRIGVTMGFMLASDNEKINQMKNLISPTDFEFIDTVDFECETRVESGEFDFGITVGPVDSAWFNCQKIGSRPFYGVISDSNPLSQKETLTFDDIKSENIILANRNFKNYGNFISKCQQNGFEPNIYKTTMEMMVIYSDCMKNNGIGISADMALVLNDYPGVKLVPFDTDEYCCEYYLITSRKNKNDTSNKYLFNTIISYMSQDQI